MDESKEEVPVRLPWQREQVQRRRSGRVADLHGHDRIMAGLRAEESGDDGDFVGVVTHGAAENKTLCHCRASLPA